MEQIFISTFEILSSIYHGLDSDDQSAMVSPQQLANQLLDWTDPQKAVSTDGATVDETIQVDLAIEILKNIYNETRSA